MFFCRKEFVKKCCFKKQNRICLWLQTFHAYGTLKTCQNLGSSPTVLNGVGAFLKSRLDIYNKEISIIILIYVNIMIYSKATNSEEHKAAAIGGTVSSDTKSNGGPGESPATPSAHAGRWSLLLQTSLYALLLGVLQVGLLSRCAPGPARSWQFC